jgi:hypothetical protein
MKAGFLALTIFVFCLVNSAGQKRLTNDPLTGLPLIPATDSGYGNEPSPMPGAQVCKSKMKAEFYTLNKTTVDATEDWYSSHLSGFKKSRGYDSGRAQIAFYKPDGTIVIFVTGNPGPEKENTNAYSVAYEQYQPGLSEKTITGITHGKMVCQ